MNRKNLIIECCGNYISMNFDHQVHEISVSKIWIDNFTDYRICIWYEEIDLQEATI